MRPIRKLFMGISGAATIAVLLSFVATFALDIDRYRPGISRWLGGRLGGELQAESIAVSFWGPVAFTLRKARFRGFTNNRSFEAERVRLEFPVTSLFGGGRKALLRVENGSIALSGPASSLLVGGARGDGADDTATEPELPAWISRSRLSVELESMTIALADPWEGAGRVVLSDARLRASPLSLAEDSEIHVSGGLVSDAVAGPVSLDLTLHTEARGAIGVAFRVDLDQARARLGRFASKKEGVAARLDGRGRVTSDELAIESAKLRIADSDIALSGTLTRDEAGARIEARAATGALPAASLASLVPELGALEPAGLLSFEARLSGPANELKLAGTVETRGFTGKLPGFVETPVFDGTARLTNWGLDAIDFAASGPGTKARIRGTWKASDRSADLALTANEANLARVFGNAIPLRVREARARVMVRQDRVAIDDFTAVAFSGQLSGSARIELGSARFAGRCKGCEIREVLALAGPPGRFRAEDRSTADIELELARSDGRVTGSGSFKTGAVELATLGFDPRRAVDELSSQVQVDSLFRSAKGDWVLADGKLRLAAISARASPGKGFDLRGEAVIGLASQDVSSSWTVSDPYDLAGLRSGRAQAAIREILAKADPESTQRTPVRAPLDVLEDASLSFRWSASCRGGGTCVSRPGAKTAVAKLLAARERREREEAAIRKIREELEAAGQGSL